MRRILILLPWLAMLAGPGAAHAQGMDTEAVWPLCGRITEDKPKRWRPAKGCPAERFGNPAFTDAPFSATFGPRPLSSEGDRYDFHRGIDLAAPVGTPIFAVTSGRVEIAGVDSGYSDPLIKLRHYRPGQVSCSGGGGCYHSFYLHVSDWVVAVDDWVEKGGLIGYTGASGASGFEHLHFEVRDAPSWDPFSAWQRDSIHPLGFLPYAAPDDTRLSFSSVDASDPSLVTAGLTVDSNRYDLVAVELAVFDDSGAEVMQPGNHPDPLGYPVYPSAWDMELWNFWYSHKDSSAYPWASFGAGGDNQCPFHADHGAQYSAHVHLDAPDPVSPFEGLFNGVHITTGKYWLTGDRRYQVGLEFLALQGPAACIEATAVFAAGEPAIARWGDCGGAVNQPPVARMEVTCDGLTCQFDGSGSTDADGFIEAFSWDLGDGGSAAGAQVGHTFPGPGTYAVVLQVTDDAGAQATAQQAVSVEDPAGHEILLALSTNRKGNRVSLTWSGALGSQVQVERDGQLLARTANDGSWNDRAVQSGQTYSYRVCETGSGGVCSALETIGL